MQARMNVVKPAAAGYKAMLALESYINGSPVPQSTLELVRLRVSQINGCAFCVNMHATDAKKAGETDERLWSVSAWREAPFFTDEERAALALAEAATRIGENPDGVSDDVWNDAADHYDEESLAALVMVIAAINAWNRINVTLRNPAAS
ncbi:carboxymuconolactone decarboxylase family protein [Actinomadura madurae]|uniref:carboxymuconolactone decarboxylase family protein n=1 Tax=Actinomadura madurae TaxID=1993 RepID=UPI0020260723|nr:carboxymuconolactone decarboxylase family protein [Actinomadura madurae]MCP9951550.1 carboxymuconolactone decarboxylase family protein [Actinomadura madurae]MCP9980787.1 carboxymuconolactone decarboxylase family protein [Actinomadura madurae]MCQ0007714.1 carboxymuconolactone decarboxylase family protein [Actinomadura madurae]MCQ0016982.1 carboxymuconolactone decarboxylase family protein [Actinomadura madurae]URN07817.1 carboxymuconolactone decarboxylase family protein [Actinomadura madurae]